MPVLILLVLLPVIVIALMPLILLQRYRAGSARRLARTWVATLSLIAMSFSTIFFLGSAAVTAIWIPGAFSFAVAGLMVGILLGVIGLGVTRWESTPRSLHYTPNRWLLLMIMLVVTVRVLFGFYRVMVAAGSEVTGTSFISAFGIPQSLAAGAVVIGYYLAFTAGLRWRIRKWQLRPLRPM